MAAARLEPWSTLDVPILTEGSNGEVWCLIVRVVANQHQAQELLLREPLPGDAAEAEAAQNLKKFLSETVCDKFKTLIESFNSLQSWNILQALARTPAVAEKPPLVSPSALVSQPVHAHSADASVPFPSKRSSSSSTHFPYPPPEGYPARDDVLKFLDDDPDFRGVDEPPEEAANAEGEAEEKQEMNDDSKLKAEENAAEEKVSVNEENDGAVESNSGDVVSKVSKASDESTDKAKRSSTSLAESEKEVQAEDPGESSTDAANDETAADKVQKEAQDEGKRPSEIKRPSEVSSRASRTSKESQGKTESTSDLAAESSDASEWNIPISEFKPNSGRRKALIIGINYSDNTLRHCVRDASFLAYMLLTRFDFRSDEIYMLTDDPHGLPGIRTGKPTRAKMLEGMAWLMRDARAGDSLFFSYSGHGTRIPDEDGDEADGWDEAICPLDYMVAGDIVDDALYHLLVRRVPPGARLTAITDSCHSGSVLDLPYLYDSDSKEPRVEVPPPPKPDSRRKRMMRKLRRLRRRNEEQDSDEEHSKITSRFSDGGEVLHISGCRDWQYSTEGDISSQGSGFMSFCLVEAIERGHFRDWHHYTYAKLVRTVADKVRAWDAEQWPMFSSSHPFNIDTPFLL